MAIASLGCVPRGWFAAPDPATVLLHAVPHAVVPQLVRRVIAGSMPPAAVCLRTLTDVAGAVSAAVATHDRRIMAADIEEFPGVLPYLTVLDFPGRQVDDGAFTAIGRIGTLQVLQLRKTNTSQSGLSALGVMPHLHTLDLSECDEVNGGALQVCATAFPALETLRLSHCRSVNCTALVHVADIASLTSLAVDRCGGVDAAGLSHIPRLTQLTDLDLSHTNVSASAFAHVQQIPQLISLVARGCTYLGADSFEFIAAIHTLTSLVLDGCPRVDETCLAYLADHPALTTLSVGRTQRLGYVWSGPQYLTCSVGSAGVEVISRMERLTSLNLCDSVSLGTEDLRRLGALQRLVHLDITRCGIPTPPADAAELQRLLQ